MCSGSLAFFWIHEYWGHPYTLTDLIELSYTSFEICLGCYSKYITYRILFSRLSDLLPVCTFASYMAISAAVVFAEVFWFLFLHRFFLALLFFLALVVIYSLNYTEVEADILDMMNLMMVMVVLILLVFLEVMKIFCFQRHYRRSLFLSEVILHYFEHLTVFTCWDFVKTEYFWLIFFTNCQIYCGYTGSNSISQTSYLFNFWKVVCILVSFVKHFSPINFLFLLLDVLFH